MPLHGLPLGTAQDEPGLAQDRPADRLDPPATMHTQVAAENGSVLEGEEQVLPHSLDPFEAPPVDSLGDAEQRGARVRRVRAQNVPFQHTETLGGAVDGVSFGHGAVSSEERRDAGPRGTLPLGGEA